MLDVLGDALRERRLAAGLTQKALAEALEMHMNTVAQWEAGRAAPNLEAIVALAHVLGVPVSLLLSPLDAVKPIPRTEGVYRHLAARGRKKRARPEGDSPAD